MLAPLSHAVPESLEAALESVSSCFYMTGTVQTGTRTRTTCRGR